MFKQPCRRHPIFPDVNNRRPDGPARALGGRIRPHACPGHHPSAQRAMLRHVQRCRGTAGGHDMATVRDRGTVTTAGRDRPGAASPSRLPITLPDLIAAIQDVVGPADDGLVGATVRHLLRSGRLTALRSGTHRCPAPRQEQRWSQSWKAGVRHPGAMARRWRCGGSPGRRGERGATRNAADRSLERWWGAMEGVLLGTASVTVLVGLAALEVGLGGTPFGRRSRSSCKRLLCSGFSATRTCRLAVNCHRGVDHDAAACAFSDSRRRSWNSERSSGG
jgi:hypothetical protein